MLFLFNYFNTHQSVSHAELDGRLDISRSFLDEDRLLKALLRRRGRRRRKGLIAQPSRSFHQLDVALDNVRLLRQTVVEADAGELAPAKRLSLDSVLDVKVVGAQVPFHRVHLKAGVEREAL